MNSSSQDPNTKTIISYKKRFPFSQLFDLKDTLTHALNTRTGYACNHGRAIFAINTLNGKLEGGCLFTDFCDNYDAKSMLTSSDGDSTEYTEGKKNLQYLGEMVSKMYDDINTESLPTEFAGILKNGVKDISTLNACYGKYVYGGNGFVSDDVSGGNLFILLSILIRAVSKAVGYEYITGESLHVKTKKIAKLYGGIVSETKLEDFKFKDGTDIQYHMDKYAERVDDNSIVEKMKKHFAASIVFRKLEPSPGKYFDIFSHTWDLLLKLLCQNIKQNCNCMTSYYYKHKKYSRFYIV